MNSFGTEMPMLKPNTIRPTPEEDAEITAAALSDPDAKPFTEAEWHAALKANEKGWQNPVNDATQEWIKHQEG